jgi:hypothetical protein
MDYSMRQVKFYKGLRFKIILGLISLLTLTMTVLFIIQYFHHRKKMIYNLQENISPHLTQMVNDILKSSMLSKNKSEMKYILEVANQYPDVRKIFILNRTGRIVTSIDDKEIEELFFFKNRGIHRWTKRVQKNKLRLIKDEK